MTNGLPIFNQRVGANSQSALDPNGKPDPNGGQVAQWNFYIYTNTRPTNFTNVAFITLPQSELGVPRMSTAFR